MYKGKRARNGLSSHLVAVHKVPGSLPLPDKESLLNCRKDQIHGKAGKQKPLVFSSNTSFIICKMKWLHLIPWVVGAKDPKVEDKTRRQKLHCHEPSCQTLPSYASHKAKHPFTPMIQKTFENCSVPLGHGDMLHCLHKDQGLAFLSELSKKKKWSHRGQIGQAWKVSYEDVSRGIARNSKILTNTQMFVNGLG